MPISIPSKDPFFNNYVTCMEYTRSLTTYRGDCTFGASEQVRLSLYVILYSILQKIIERNFNIVERRLCQSNTTLRDSDKLVPF